MTMLASTRSATPADVPALVRVINRAYLVEQFFIAGDRTTEADVTRRMNTPGATFLAIDGRAGQFAGAVYVEVAADRGFFAMLAVDPDRRKEGLGRRLVEAAEDHCRAAGCRFLDLDVVNLRTELPAFYTRLGFAPYGVEPFHRSEHQELKRSAHLILMTKPLVDLWAR